MHIKPTDEVSKMVCHRCCEIALKLYKYRNNAVAHDKLLKERCGQPYSPPITDLEELLRIVSKTVPGESNNCDESIIILDDDSDDPLELLNVSIQKEIVHQPSSIALNAQHRQTSGPSCFATALDQPTRHVAAHGLLSDNQDCRNQREATREVTNIAAETPVSESSRESSQISNPSVIRIGEQRPSVILDSPRNIQNSAVSANSCKNAPKMRCKHPSVRELFKTFEGIILPKKIFKSDISPVISLDSAEVTDWYKKQLNQKLLSVFIKKVPNSSNYAISSSPLISPKPTAVTGSKQNIGASSDTSMVTSLKQGGKISPIKYKLQPNYQRIIPTNKFYGDAVNIEKTFNYDHQKENDIPQVMPKASSTDHHSTTSSENNVTLDISANRRITKSIKTVNSQKKVSTKKNNGRRSRIIRKRTLLDDNEIIPNKKKRVYCNKNAVEALNKMELPQVCPSDRNEQKAIFTSSLELRPVIPLSLSKSTGVERLLLVEKEFVEQFPSLEPIGLPELVTSAIHQIFLCPVCNEACDTKKQLLDHQSTHPKCTFCNKTVENVQLLKKHQKETCFAIIVNNKPLLKLRRVDATPSIVKKYPQAFEELNISTQTQRGGDLSCNECMDYSELAPHIEEIVLPTPSNGLFIALEETDQNFESIKQCEQNSQTAMTSQNSEVVYVSDESDDDIPREKITENPYFSSAAETGVSSTNTSVNQVSNKATSISMELNRQLDKPKCVSEFPCNLSEKELIRHLLKKYLSPPKLERHSQTISNADLASVKCNLITIDNMFAELLTYKVPIRLEFGTEMNATFKERVTIPDRHPATLECWAHKKIVSIQKPRYVPPNDASTVIVVPNKTDIPPGKHITHSNELTIKKSNSSGVATAIPYVNNSCNSSSSVPADTCTSNVSVNQQAPTFVMESLNSNVLSLQTAGVSRSIPSTAAKVHQNYHRSTVSSGCTSNITTTFNSSVVSSASLTIANASSSDGALTCAVRNSYSIQQARNGTVTASTPNTAPVAATCRQYHNRNATALNMCTKMSTAGDSTFGVPLSISETSANTLSPAPSASTMAYTRYAYQQSNTNFMPIELSNSVANPHRNTVISQNNAPVALQNLQECHKKSTTVCVTSVAMPVAPPVPTVVACSNPYQPPYSNFMQIVAPYNSAIGPYQAGVVTTPNITINNTNVVPYTVPITTTNNIYSIVPTPAMVNYNSNAQTQTLPNYVNITKWTNATVSYQATPFNNNATNMHTGVVTNTVTLPKLPVPVRNNTYETSCLYNACSNSLLAREYCNQRSEIEIGNQSNVVTTEAHAQTIYNGVIRVKPIAELV